MIRYIVGCAALMALLIGYDPLGFVWAGEYLK